MLNSLAQVAIKLTCPGVPDVYQGCEKWDLSLVDPDNRRPVDFEDRRRGLNGADNDWPALLERWSDGGVKLALTHRLLRLRQELPALFTSGAYVPLDGGGPRAGHVVGFERVHRRQKVAVVVGRFFAKLSDGDPQAYGPACWEDSWVALPDARADVLSGRTLRASNGKLGLADAFRSLPVAVLVAR